MTFEGTVQRLLGGVAGGFVGMFVVPSMLWCAFLAYHYLRYGALWVSEGGIMAVFLCGGLGAPLGFWIGFAIVAARVQRNEETDFTTLFR